MELNQLLKAHQTPVHPVFLPDLTPANTVFLNLSDHADTDPGNASEDPGQVDDGIFSRIREKKATYGYGGYMEDRSVYRRSPLFRDDRGNARSIHLGVDVWAPAGTTVYMPLEGTVHSFQDNDSFGDYGPTIITRHVIGSHAFFCLYGHLSKNSLRGIQEGTGLAAGKQLGTIGDRSENGEWPPHLHLQIITDMLHWKGDFPGVCFSQEMEKYSTLCPDPIVFFSGLSDQQGSVQAISLRG